MERVGAAVGLVETIRARNGRVPWLERHMARLRAASAAIGLEEPRHDIAELVRGTAGPGDRVVRLELRDGYPELTTREVSRDRFPVVVVSDEVHRAYPHKTTARQQFDRALSGAKRVGADDALLLTAAGEVAEGTAWNVFWWDGESLYTPAADLGILPGIGRARVMELTDVKEVRAPAAGIVGRSLFLVNAVRGIVAIGTYERTRVPQDPRTAELSSAFWPD